MAYEKKLVVYRTSGLDYFKKGPDDELEEFLKKEGRTMEGLKKEKEETDLTMDLVSKIFSDAKIINRKELSEEKIEGYDLVIPVGGDGTLLEVSHHILGETPVFFVNSDYRKDGGSEGYYAAANRHNLKEKSRELLKGKLGITKLSRLEAELNGNKIKELILNDILVAHKIPAGMTWYDIRINNCKWIEHKNSGLWVASGAGSTGAVRSCGGKVLPADSENMQFAEMAPYKGRLTKGRKTKKVFKKEDVIEIESRMSNGVIYIDGKFVSYEFPLGKTLKVYNPNKPFYLIGFDHENRKNYL